MMNAAEIAATLGDGRGWQWRTAVLHVANPSLTLHDGRVRDVLVWL